MDRNLMQPAAVADLSQSPACRAVVGFLQSPAWQAMAGVLQSPAWQAMAVVLQSPAVLKLHQCVNDLAGPGYSPNFEG